MGLNDWDRRLLNKHLAFYRALAEGQRIPETEAQKHFVDVFEGRARARTQHEVAYQKFLQLSGQGAGDAPLRVNTTLPTNGPEILDATRVAEPDPSFEQAEAAIDAIETVELGERLVERLGARAGRILGEVKEAYRSGAAVAGQRSSEAALWLAALTADSEWAARAGGAAGEAFNNVSTIYTKAMDAGFAEGLKSGPEYVSPWIHRLVDGGHTVAGAWEKVKSATPDDTRLQEIAGFTEAYLSDFASRAGMPLVTVSEETYRVLDSVVRSAGLPVDWTRDALTVNLEEFASAFVPGLAVLLNWNAEDRDAFRQMLGSVAVAGVVAASPVALVVLLVGMAREFHLKRKGEEGVRAYAEAFANGGLMSGLVITSSAVIGGPVWVGMVSGIVIVMLAKQASARIQWKELLRALRSLVVDRSRNTPVPREVG